MADANRADTYALILRLMERPHSFHFFQAVRRLECAMARGPRLGATSRIADDPVRFGQEPSLAFAPSSLARFTQTSSDAQRLYVHFFGLLGPNGPMPLHITEYVHDRQRHHRDDTLAAFLDVFHHRMISLFFRAWAINQPTVDFDRTRSSNIRDRFGAYVASSSGLAEESSRSRDTVSDLAKLYYTGLMSNPTKHADGIKQIVADFFKVPARIEPFIGQWIELDSGDQCQMGTNPGASQLGVSAIVGSRVWDVTQKFRMVLGPMRLVDYERLLPSGTSFKRLVDWIKNYTGYELGFEAQLILKREEVPQTRLGESGSLGWTTWLRSAEMTDDADDLVLQSGI
jgi:type VI secretion system protein ImpH